MKRNSAETNEMRALWTTLASSGSTETVPLFRGAVHVTLVTAFSPAGAGPSIAPIHPAGLSAHPEKSVRIFALTVKKLQTLVLFP